MEIQRGSVGDQPWGLTLGALSQRATTGELTITDGPLRIVLALDAGRLVGATSTMRAGSLLERATRTFELARGSWVLTDEITLRRDRLASFDLREVVFAGARKYLPDDRLTGELRQLGSRFTLTPVGATELVHYALDLPGAVIDTLREGATLAELEARHVDGRAVRAAIYALVCCGSARGLLPSRAPTPPPIARTTTPSRTTTPGRTPTPPQPGRTSTPGTARTVTPGTARAVTPNTGRAITPNTARAAAMQTPPSGSRAITPDAPGATCTPTPPSPPAGARTTTPQASSPASTRTTTPNDSGAVLARIPTVNIARVSTSSGGGAPEPSRSPTPPSTRATTEDLGSRVPTVSMPSRATTEDVAARVPTMRDRPPLPSDALAPETIRDPVSGRTRTRATPFRAGDLHALAAEAAERARGHLAAHEPQLAVTEATAAAQLVPESFDYLALQAWATFCAAEDRSAAADHARRILEKASHRADQPHEVRLLLARLERAVGREREALRHLRAVLERVPDHAQAAAELRELEEQLEAYARR